LRVAEADAEGGVTGDRRGCCGTDGVETGELRAGEWGHSGAEVAELMERAKAFRAESVGRMESSGVSG
jgi:hypothetical protein